MSERQVSKDVFYATVGTQDVVPRVDVSTLKGRFNTSIWEDRARRRVGRTVSDSWGSGDNSYFIEEHTA